MNDEKRDQCAERLKALADAKRLAIVQFLQDGEKTAREIDEHLKSRASDHLIVLRYAGIVQRERRGMWTYYSLRPEVVVQSDCLNLGCCQIQFS